MRAEFVKFVAYVSMDTQMKHGTLRVDSVFIICIGHYSETLKFEMTILFMICGREQELEIL